MPADAGDKPVPVRPANAHPESRTTMTFRKTVTTTHYTFEKESSIQRSSEILLKPENSETQLIPDREARTPWAEISVRTLVLAKNRERIGLDAGRNP